MKTLLARLFLLSGWFWDWRARRLRKRIDVADEKAYAAFSLYERLTPRGR